MIEIQAMFPVMVTQNLAAVKQFYETVFGFNAVFYSQLLFTSIVTEYRSSAWIFIA